METSSFDEQIFSDFAGPLSPLGAKQIQQSGHSIHVMLGMNSGNSSELCNQRLPEVQSLLPGSTKLTNHYKSLDYMNNKMDYNGKMASYSSTPPPPPPPKYDYLNGKLDQYSPSHLTKIDYIKPMDYNSNAKIDYGNNSNKMDYDQHMQMYQHQTQQQQQHQSQPSQSIESSSSLCDKKKSDDSHSMGSTTPTTTSDATSTSKKNDKKKGDINGVKKKKTR